MTKNIFCKNKTLFFIVLTTLIIVGSVAFGSRVFSYNDTITHPSLTDNAAKIYNANFDRKLSDEEIDWLKQGSIEEDRAPRWMNHFYNPIAGVGLMGGFSSKVWADSFFLQIREDGDNETWQRAIDSYLDGDRKSAFIALGHVLHLLEDATVPAHTRLDAHPEGDPYESWVMNKVGWNINFNVAPVAISNLNMAFDDLASYSSNNFLSKDTIQLGLSFKEEIIDKRIFLLYQDKFGNNYKVLEKTDIDGKSSYMLSDPVHSDYFSLLAPKAISYSAGTIKLFFDEAEKKKQEEQQKSWWEKLKESTSNWLASISGSLYAGIATGNAGNVAPSESAPVGAANEAPGNVAPLALPLNTLLPANTVVTQQKIAVRLPPNTITAQEKAEGDIVEEVLPQDVDVPPAIVEEAIPSQAKMPAAVVSPSPIPALAFSSGGGSAPTVLPTPTPSPSSSPSPTPTPSPTPDAASPETTIDVSPASAAATTTATFEFSSSEATSTFSCQLDSATSTVCVSPVIYDNLAEGGHTFKVSATDAAGNEDATPAEYSWTINLAPEAVVSLSSYGLSNLNFTVNWNSSSSDVTHYDSQYKINADGAWQDWAMATTTTLKSFEASRDNVIYYFRVRAIDSAGQAGVWQEIQAPISLKPVVINEIMYDPNPGNDSYYEYVELYNRSPIAIDLADWKFAVGDSVHNLSADAIHGGSSTIISSGGFALLSDKATSTTTASVYDGYYNVPAYSPSVLRLSVSNSSSLSLLNSGANLILKNDLGDIIDQVSYSSSWGANNNGKSLERINYNNIYSDNQDAWQASLAGGTPNAPNSALNISAGTLVKDNAVISQDTIWTKSGSPYLLFSNAGAYPTVAAGAILTIEPGVEIKPQNKYYYALYVKGTLKAEGTEGDPIVMTSKEDSPQAGDWGTGIYFSPESANSSLTHTTFKYGGYQRPFPWNDFNPAVVVDNAKVNFDNCLFQSTQGRAVYLISSDSSVINSRFLNSTDAAVYVSGSSTSVIKNNVFQNSGYMGIAIKIDDQAKPRLESNNISGFDAAVWLESAYPDFSGNSFNDNNYNGVYVSDHTVISQNTAWQSGVTYLLLSNSGVYPTVATSTTLILEPGVVIKPMNKYYSALKIEGSLMADGNSEATLINFTSFKDDSMGGDSNNDIGAAVPDSILTGDWKNIWFADGSQSNLKFVRFQYGGYMHGPYGDWRDKNESLKIDTGAQVSMEEIGVE